MPKVRSSRQVLEAGGGPFELDRVTIGVFQTDQEHHRFSAGSDKASVLPVEAGDGWIMPEGGEGICLFEMPLDLITVSFDTALLRDAGLEDPKAFAPSVGKLDPLLVQFISASSGWEDADMLYRETMERALAAHLVQSVAPTRPESTPIEDRRLRSVVEYIHDHLADELSLASMATLSALSEAQFSRAFKSATGASPLQYVIAARQDQAALLLKTTPLPIAEVAYRVGYSDLSRFGQHFKRRFGTTPARYRTA